MPKIESPGDYDQQVVVAGSERSHKIHVPDDYRPDQPMPAVIMLHGINQDADSFAARTQMNLKADNEGFIAVYPQSNKLLDSDSHRAWNVRNWGLFHPAKNVDDVGFADKVIDNVQKQLAVDPDRTYLSGFSNGVMLAQAVAEKLGEKLAGIALVGAALSGANSAPAAPLSVLDIHGTQDPIVPYSGWSHALGLVNMSPVSETASYRSQADQTGDPLLQENGSLLISDAFNHDSGLEVKQIAIRGGKHGWPRASSPDSAARALSATDEIWDFFSHHTLTQNGPG